MDKQQIKVVLDRVLTWPVARQLDAIEILLMMEESDNSPYWLTDEQAAEVRRRLADGPTKVLTLDEVRDYLERRLNDKG